MECTCSLECKPITYRGDIAAPIVVVGAAPTLDEVDAGMSVAGASGRYLLEVLQREGFALNEILFVNAILCHSPEEVTLKILQSCQPQVHDIINRAPRKLIIALGNESWATIHNFRKIGGVRVGCGKVIHCEKYDCWSVWNINPQFALRSQNWKPEFEHAIRRAYQTYTVGAPQRPPATILSPPDTLPQALEYIAQAASCDAVSFDIETGNPKGIHPNYQTDPILGIGFGWSDPQTYKKSAFYLPILHGECCQPVWSIEDWVAIDTALRTHIFNGTKKLVAQNGKFDARFLRFQYNYKCDIWFDTIVAHRLIDENKAHSLKSMARFWLNAPDWDVFDKVEKGDHLGMMPLDEVAEYCAYDAVYTYELCELFQDMLEGQSYEKVFYELDQPLFNELVNVELEGMRVDPEAMLRIEEALLEEIQVAEQECNELSGWAGKVLPHKDKRNKNGELKKGITLGVNPNSPKDIQFILYEHFNIPLPTDKYDKKKYCNKDGGGKTDKITLDYHLYKKVASFNDDGEEIEIFCIPLDAPVRVFVKAYQHYRSLRTLYGNVIKGVRENIYPDGRVHTNYGFSMRDDNNSPVSGRLSSNSPNMQNIKKEFKPMFMSPYEGWSIIEFDYKQSEVRCAAYMSGDTELKEAVCSQDFHSVTAAAAFNKAVEDITVEERNASKTLVFGAWLYGGEEAVVTRVLHCSKQEAEKLLNGLKNKYKVCTQWLENQTVICAQRGYVETIFSRQRRLPEIWSSNESEVSSAKRQAKNSPTQGGSAELTNLAIVRIAKYLRENNYQAKIINTVHDSIVVTCPPEECDEVVKVCSDIMITPPFPEFDIELGVDSAVYDRWGGELNINAIKGLKDSEEIIAEGIDILESDEL